MCGRRLDRSGARGSATFVAAILRDRLAPMTYAPVSPRGDQTSGKEGHSWALLAILHPGSGWPCAGQWLRRCLRDPRNGREDLPRHIQPPWESSCLAHSWSSWHTFVRYRPRKAKIRRTWASPSSTGVLGFLIPFRRQAPTVQPSHAISYPRCAAQAEISLWAGWL